MQNYNDMISTIERRQSLTNMANGDFFDTFLRNAANYNGGEPEYYEDTHDANGNYIGSRRFTAAAQPSFTSLPPQQAQPAPTTPVSPVPQQPPVMQQPYAPVGYAPNGYTPPPTVAQQRTEYNLQNPPLFAQYQNDETAEQPKPRPKPIPLPTTKQYISPQLNQNFVIYQPRTTADVEQLIAYLRRREPALVDLDPIADSPDAQRLMDFTSGAAYALGAAVMTVRRNLFLITPETIDVLKPDSEK